MWMAEGGEAPGREPRLEAIVMTRLIQAWIRTMAQEGKRDV